MLKFQTIFYLSFFIITLLSISPPKPTYKDPYINSIDQIIKSSFSQAGQIYRYTTSLGQLSINYQIYYDSGLKIVGSYNKDSSIFQIKEYQYINTIPSKKQTKMKETQIISKLNQTKSNSSQISDQYEPIPFSILRLQKFKLALFKILKSNQELNSQIDKLEWSKSQNDQIRITFTIPFKKKYFLYSKIPSIHNLSNSSQINNSQTKQLLLQLNTTKKIFINDQLQSQKCKLCLEWSNDKCIKCKEGTYLFKQQQSLRKDLNCKEFKNNGQCEKCKEQYIIKDGFCIKNL